MGVGESEAVDFDPVRHRARVRRRAITVVVIGGLMTMALLYGDFFRPSKIVTKGSNPRIFVETKTEGAMDALAEFRLGYSPAGRCFFTIQDPPNSARHRTPIVWPAGTHPQRQGDRVGVRVGGGPWGLFGGTTFWVGDLVSAGGGEIDPPNALADIADECFGTSGERKVWVAAPGPEHLRRYRP
jgi:hypothetical protein